jgi:hypothetical protein
VHDYAKSFPLADGALGAGATCFCAAHDAFPEDPACALTASRSTTLAVGDVPGAMYTVSADGQRPGTGIFWATRAGEDKPTSGGMAAGVVEAYAADDLSVRLWTSAARASDDLGLFAKFTPPVVANGKVYVATMSGRVVVYGPIDATTIRASD